MVNEIIKKVVNIPFVWNTGQRIVGANPWKVLIYPSVFDTKGKILDFGCSIGNSTEAFLDFEYYGVDIDARAIEAARKRWRRYPNVHFEALDILAQPFKVDFFDHVLFACTAHHLTDEQLTPTLDVLLKFLNHGGQLHFYDVIRQPGKDRFTTRLIMQNDQGKNMRTKTEYEAIFCGGKYLVTETRMFPSPDRWIKLQDMVYFRLMRS